MSDGKGDAEIVFSLTRAVSEALLERGRRQGIREYEARLKRRSWRMWGVYPFVVIVSYGLGFFLAWIIF